MHIILLLFFFTTLISNEFVTITILAKDKSHCLPLYLFCIENQTYPKKLTNLYIRTNNNNDTTAQMLREWIKKVGQEYAHIYFDDSDVPQNIQQYKQHEWNYERFKVLGKIRQDSIQWAIDKNSHYFVVDCDNFIFPFTLESLFDANLPIVAPLLYSNNAYSNFHANIDANGYCWNSPLYLPILNREIKGLIQMPVVHCTYFIRKEILPLMTYDDNSYRYEYVIFSDNARKKNIPQYLDTREIYGYLTLAENTNELIKESWFLKFSTQLHAYLKDQETYS